MSHYLMRGIAVLALVFAIGSTAHAETTTTTSDKDALIKELKARIVVLEAEIAALKGGDPATANDAPAWLRPNAFRMGMSSEEVKKFQEWLAQMPDIYPEGAVTGYFGPLTRQALIRFQMKNGLAAGGELDEETIAKIKGHLKIRMDNRGEGKPTAPPAVRLGNGKGVPVCVTEDGDHETHFAKTIAEWRELVADGAKPGMCKKEDVKEEDDDEEEEEDEDELEIEVRIENGDATVTVTFEGETDTFEVDSDDREDIIDEILERYNDLDEDEVEEVIEFEEEDEEEEEDDDEEEDEVDNN